jgi:hypothetical protein
MDGRKFKKPYKKRGIVKKIVYHLFSKDYSHNKTFKLAATPLLPRLVNDKVPILDQGGNPWCTAASSCAIRQAMTGNEYDIQGQWNLECQHEGANPNTTEGFNIDVPAKVGKELGFVLKGQGFPTDKVGGYFWVQKRPGLDWFDTLHTIRCEQFARTGKVICYSFGTNWYRSWITPSGVIPSNNDNLAGGHDAIDSGRDQINGEDVEVNPNTWGIGQGNNGKFYFNRVATNKNIGDLGGIFYWLDAEDMPDDPVRVGIMQQIISALQKVIPLLQQLIGQKQPLPIIPDQVLPPPAPQPDPPVSRIVNWSKAIAIQEGYYTAGSRAQRNLNPGNLRLGSFTKNCIHSGTDKDNFLIFSSETAGFIALRNFLTSSCKGEFDPTYRADMPLIAFTKTYAEPPSDAYADNVAKYIGVTPNEPIKNLL